MCDILAQIQLFQVKLGNRSSNSKQLVVENTALDSVEFQGLDLRP